MRPSLAPTVAKLRREGLGRATKVDASYKVFASERHIKFTEMEYAVPRERGRELIEGVLEIAARPELHVAWPIEVRFVKGDDSFLSPSHEQDTCYVAVHQDRKLGWEHVHARRRVARRRARRPPALGQAPLPHSGGPRGRYPRWDDFQAARKRLDPDGVFTNAYTDRVLGTVP